MKPNIFSNACAYCTRDCPFAHLAAKQRESFCMFLQPAYQEIAGDQHTDKIDTALHPSLTGAILFDFEARLN